MPPIVQATENQPTLQPQPSKDGAHHWYPVVEQVRTCGIGFQTLQSLVKQLHRGINTETKEGEEQLLLCKDVRDRFQMWSASFNVANQTLDHRLRKSMGIAGVVFKLFDGILELCHACMDPIHIPY